MSYHSFEEAAFQSAAAAAPQPQKAQHIDVILRDPSEVASASLIVEFYRALNDLSDEHNYSVHLRYLGKDMPGDPVYWSNRSAIFWGDIHESWRLSRSERQWSQQVISLSPRTTLVGGAIFILSQTGMADEPKASIHPNFSVAAVEENILDCGTDAYLARSGKLHSASSRLAALRLLVKFAELDHGRFAAETLSAYIGLAEQAPKRRSKVAEQLIRKSCADPLVTDVIDTMLDHVEDPLKISDIASIHNMSTRRLQRHFLNKAGAKPLSTYRSLRLERARHLLKHTDMAMVEVSAAAGFSSQADMSRWFKQHYSISPLELRRKRYERSRRPAFSAPSSMAAE